MAKKYDDYGYEDGNGNSFSLRRILILVFIVIAIIVVIFLLRSCNGKDKKETTTAFNYETEILKAGKKYYENNTDHYPTAVGECTQVELVTLIERGLLTKDKFTTCNTTASYVQVCNLENGSKQFTPWLSCTDYDSDKLYSEYKEGTVADVVTDSSMVKFMFKPQIVDSSKTTGNTLEMWKDEIKYDSYQTLSTTKYYRYRDMLYIWNVENKKYYTHSGEKDSTEEYYPSVTDSKYTKSESKSTGYKWYTSDSKKVYAMTNGSKTYSATAIEGYPYYDGGVKFVRYYTRKVTGTYQPTLYYTCAVSKNSTYAKNQTVPCGEGSDPQLVTQIDTFYSCVGSTSDNDSVVANKVSQGTLCKTYSEWTGPSKTSCGSTSDVCKKYEGVMYNWYKLEEGAVRTYYPSGKSTASEESVYYVSAPVKNAQKDETTKNTAVYKWYRTETAQTTDYLAVAPSGKTATQTTDSKWGSWSSWSTKKNNATDGRKREIETRVKVKFKLYDETEGTNWKDLSDKYVTEEELFNIYKEQKLNVSELKDVEDYGQIRYQVQMYVRNKKESN